MISHALRKTRTQLGPSSSLDYSNKVQEIVCSHTVAFNMGFTFMWSEGVMSFCILDDVLAENSYERTKILEK